MQVEEFKKSVFPFKNKMYRLAKWLVLNSHDAEDIVQEAFIKLWSLRNELAKYRSIEALAMKITKNLSLNRLKSNRRLFSGMEHLEIREGNPSPDKRIELSESLRITELIIQKLPEQQRIALQLRHIEGYSTEEIAQVMDLTENNVRVILTRARKYMRDSFQDVLLE